MSDCKCGRPTRDSAFVCDTCSDDLSRALGEVPWLDEQLDITLTRQKGVDYRAVGGSKGGQKAAERPSPVTWAASDARTNLKGLLVSWTLFCHEEQVRNQSPHSGLPVDTLPALSGWLLWRVDGLALNEIGPDAVEEITAAVHACHRLIDRHPEKRYAGPCGSTIDTDGEETTCTEELYAKVGAKRIACPNCGTTWDVDERREWLLERAMSELATAVEISRAVSWLGAAPLTAAVVRQWAKRERIFAKGHNRNGQPLYRVGDAIDLLSGSRKESA